MFATIRTVPINKTHQTAVGVMILTSPAQRKINEIKKLAISSEGIKAMKKIKNTDYLLGLRYLEYEVLFPRHMQIMTDELFWASYTTYNLYCLNKIIPEDGKLTRFELICSLQVAGFSEFCI